MKKNRDPLIEEVRRARMELSSEFGHDIKKLCAYLRKEERKHPQRLVKPRRANGTHRKADALA
jgi:hypothetical protein